MRQRKILGIRVDLDSNVEEVADLIGNLMLKDKESRYICTTNPEFIMAAQKDEDFKKIINESALSLPDGIGVILADKFMGYCNSIEGERYRVAKALGYGIRLGVGTLLGEFRGRTVTGVSLVEKLCELSAQKGYSIFLLGGWPKDWKGNRVSVEKDFATSTADTLRNKYPRINIIGSTSKFTPRESDDASTLDYIHECMKNKNVETLDFIFVAYNHPKQEKWIVRNSYRLPCRVSIGVGGTFDYISGHCKKVPSFIATVGLEWLVRLLRQPFRMARIFTAFPSFPFKVFINCTKINHNVRK